MRWIWVGSAVALAAGVGVQLLPSAAPVSRDLYAILGASPSASDADLKKWVGVTTRTLVLRRSRRDARIANCAAQEYAGNTARATFTLCAHVQDVSAARVEISPRQGRAIAARRARAPI